MAAVQVITGHVWRNPNGMHDLKGTINVDTQAYWFSLTHNKIRGMAVPKTDLHVLDFTQGFVFPLLGDEGPSKAKVPRLRLVSQALNHLHTKRVI